MKFLDLSHHSQHRSTLVTLKTSNGPRNTQSKHDEGRYTSPVFDHSRATTCITSDERYLTYEPLRSACKFVQSAINLGQRSSCRRLHTFQVVFRQKYILQIKVKGPRAHRLRRQIRYQTQKHSRQYASVLRHSQRPWLGWPQSVYRPKEHDLCESKSDHLNCDLSPVAVSGLPSLSRSENSFGHTIVHYQTTQRSANLVHRVV